MTIERRFAPFAAVAGLIALVVATAVAMGPGPDAPAIRVTPTSDGFVLAAAGPWREERLSLPELIGVLRQAGWDDQQVVEALRVAGCESGWQPRAIGSAGEQGLFQIHPVHFWRFRERGPGTSPMDPVANARIALEIWTEEGWAPWSCAPE
ncbi:MAG: hypothetical protein Kow0010_01150 [Dehalococcoidia bacterium]